MGYAVYRDIEGHDRWAGYGVPAICDWADCEVAIDRGLGYKCEDHGDFELMLDGKSISYDRLEEEPDAEEEWVKKPGCGLYFCDLHMHDTESHDGVKPKSDTVEWIRHMLDDESWAEWRAENPVKVEAMLEVA